MINNRTLIQTSTQSGEPSAPTRRLPMLKEMAPAFVPVPIAPATPESPAIRIEIRRGNAAIKIDWPTHAAGACATWLRDWLR